jgi:hypothetical protein
MLYNTQNVLCPSFGILNNQKTQHLRIWICFHLQVSGGRHSVGSLQTALQLLDTLWAKLGGFLTFKIESMRSKLYASRC